MFFFFFFRTGHKVFRPNGPERAKGGPESLSLHFVNLPHFGSVVFFSLFSIRQRGGWLEFFANPIDGAEGHALRPRTCGKEK